MTIFKTQKEIATLREAGRRLALVLEEVLESAVSGVSEKELDVLAERLIREGGDVPVFLGYQPQGAPKPYPATMCVSVNNEVVHSVPTDRVLKDGDIVVFDIGLSHKGACVDMAKTIGVGMIDAKAKHLKEVTEEALVRGIAAVRAGAHVGDIGNAVASYVEKAGFSIVRELGGHGIGKEVHEEPFIPNFGSKGTGPELKEGMAIAIEPIVNEGKAGIKIGEDGFVYETQDGKRSAHFEHTILVTKGGAEIITQL